eukprot:6201633-Pleurochrysis_carterae.AAC.3
MALLRLAVSNGRFAASKEVGAQVFQLVASNQDRKRRRGKKGAIVTVPEKIEGTDDETGAVVPRGSKTFRRTGSSPCVAAVPSTELAAICARLHTAKLKSEPPIVSSSQGLDLTARPRPGGSGAPSLWQLDENRPLPRAVVKLRFAERRVGTVNGTSTHKIFESEGEGSCIEDS